MLGDRGWLKSTCVNIVSPTQAEPQIWIEAWDESSKRRTQHRLTPDEAFQFALDILSDVSLAKFGRG